MKKVKFFSVIYIIFSVLSLNCYSQTDRTIYIPNNDTLAYLDSLQNRIIQQFNRIWPETKSESLINIKPEKNRNNDTLSYLESRIWLGIKTERDMKPKKNKDIDTIIYTKRYAYVYLDTNFEAGVKDFLLPMLITSSISALTFYSITTANPVLFGIFANLFMADIILTYWYAEKYIWRKNILRLKMNPKHKLRVRI